MPSSKLRFRKPMLAKNYESHVKKVQFPCYVQPKVDGIRCVTDGQRFWSRNGKLFPIENLAHLQVRGLKYLIDGELSVTDGEEFEDVVSRVKRAGHDERARICFNAFDILSPEPYIVRKAQLKHVFERTLIKVASGQWSRLITKKVCSVEDLYTLYDTFLERGYEGLMIRSAMGHYVSKRTHDLLKWKPLRDKEFEIADVKQARGKDKGTPIYVCYVGRPADKLTFRVRPMGTLAQRRKMWRNRANAPGCMLTVEYQNLTKYGKPRFPRAKVLRDYE